MPPDGSTSRSPRQSRDATTAGRGDALPELSRDEYTQLVALARRVKAGQVVRGAFELHHKRGTLRLFESTAYDCAA